MFGWLKRKEKPKPCRHYKSGGERSLSNMVRIFEFDEITDRPLPYAIYQCAECGKRSFGCAGLHFMPPSITDKIDDFINHKMGEGEFVSFLEREFKYWKRFKQELTHDL